MNTFKVIKKLALRVKYGGDNSVQLSFKCCPTIKYQKRFFSHMSRFQLGDLIFCFLSWDVVFVEQLFRVL